MKPETTLTWHGQDRTNGRSSLSFEEIKDIIDNGLTTPLGVEKSSRRMHILFFSPIDGECFVAVQDEKTKQIITVLPPDFDGRCKVSGEAINDLLVRHGVLPNFKKV